MYCVIEVKLLWKFQCRHLCNTICPPHQGISQLYFFLDHGPWNSTKEPTTVEINIEDRLHHIDRSNRFAKLSQSGPQIQIENLGQKCSNKKFLVEFKQTRYIEEDTSKGCVNYPNKYESYNECDEAFMRDILRGHYPPDFLPFWIGGVNATEWMVDTKITERIYSDLFKGTLMPPKDVCPLPCTSTTRSTDFLYEMQEDVAYSTIDITFSDKVEVTSWDYGTFSIAEVLASLGGSMGLWLGVGVVQLLETLLALPTQDPRRQVKNLVTASVTVGAGSIKCTDCHKLVHTVPLTSHPPENGDLHNGKAQHCNEISEIGNLMAGNQHHRHPEHAYA